MALIAGGAASALVVWALAARGVTGPPPRQDRPSQPVAGLAVSAARAAPVDASPPAPANIAEPPPPAGVSPAQWAALRAEMAQRPDGAAELARLADYLNYSDAAQRFRRLRQGGGTSPELRALAAQLDAGLPDRLARHEMTAGEAQQIKTAVLEVQVDDLAERTQRLQRWRDDWRQQQQRQAPPPDARQAAFLQRQDALVAAWQAQPPALRDPRALEQQLDALRRQSFPTSSGGP
ncbi:hypothetical protein [Aquabacterium sp.]|uniref:hypothetical protein n=1 Tax=Aquabacterium sp. TaxID=1872578 RepID=UPI003783FD41